MNARIAAALNLEDYAFMQTDSNTYKGAMTYNGVINYVASQGGGGGGGYEWTPFIYGITAGTPFTNDSTCTINQMAGNHIEVYRGTTAALDLQWLNETAVNGRTGYRYNSSGQIVVRPAWSTGDRAIIKAYPASGVSKDTLTGGGSSDILEDLRAYWDMNEGSGTIVNDYLDTYHGATNATVAQSGKWGYAHAYTRANSDVATFGTTVGDVGTSDFTFACWVYIPDTAKLTYGIMGNWGQEPFYYLYVNEFDYRAKFVWNFGGAEIEIDGNAFIPQATWTHLAITADRSGNATMYINGVAQTDVEDISADVAVAGNNNIVFDIGNIGNSHATYYFGGSIDDAAIWLRLLTQDEITALQTGPVN
jgi:hypothetical protein